MRRMVTLAALLLIGSTVAPAQNPATKAELLRIATDQFAAIERGDMAAYGSSMGEDLIYIPDWGTAYTKTEILARTLRTFQQGVGKKFEDIGDVRVVDNGSSAVLSFEVTEYHTYGDQKLRDRLRRTLHFVRRDGRWVAVAIQFTDVPENHRVALRVDSMRLKAFVGRYSWTPGLVNTITLEGGKLLSQWRPDGPKTEQFALDDSTFFARNDLAEIIFMKNEAGRVTHYIFRRTDGQQIRAERIK